MFDLIDRLLGVRSDLLEPHPNQDGTADMNADDTRLATLITLQAGDLLGLSVKLLNRPAPAILVLNG